MRLRWKIKSASFWFYWYLWFDKGYRGNQHDSRLQAVLKDGGMFEIVGNFVDADYAHNWSVYHICSHEIRHLLIPNASLEECVSYCENLNRKLRLCHES